MEPDRTSREAAAPAARGAASTARSRRSAVTGSLYVLASAVALVAVAPRIDDRWLLAGLLAAFPLLTAVVIIDSRTRRIRARLVAIVAATTTASLIGSAAASGSATSVGRSAVAGAAVGAGYLVLHKVADVGLGDVRLAAVLGAIAGSFSWATLLAFVVLAHFVAVPEALWHLVRRDDRWMAFGPPLIAGLYLATWVTTAR